MAKGNIGNFLQHFVGLTAASRLNAAAGRFEYVDPFAMAPWEALEKAEADFWRVFRSLDRRPVDDEVARVFRAAFSDRYPSGRPRLDGDVEYPNTTVLLLHAGLVPRRVTACEIGDDKRDALRSLLAARSVQHELHADSRTSRLTACRGAALVMLDAFQVQAPRRKDAAGYITVDEIRGLLGSSNVDVLGRARRGTAEPCVVTIFSFSEQLSSAEETDRALRAELGAKWGWRVHLVREAMQITTGSRREGWHQGWWCASHESVEPAGDLQRAWNTWRAVP